MSAPNGGPAFPHLEVTSRGEPYHDHLGMTLRDYFAAKALAGILMNYTTQKFGASEFTVAAAAYQYADAMLAAREARK